MYLKQRLAAGELLLGAGMFANSPEAIEHGARGMDWIWWEGQHTHADWQTMAHGVRTANWLQIPILLRTWTQDGGTIERLLDTGTEGIIVPMVDTPEQAAEIVSHCYYPPVGNRSIGSVRTEVIEADTDEWNRRVVTVMMIESPLAVQNAEAIANVLGVDALFVGMRDLAMRKGEVVNDYTAAASVSGELEHVLRICQKAGRAAAVVASSTDELVQRIGDGYRLICAGFDLNFLQEGWAAMRQAAAQVRIGDKRDD
jgi:2-keto-3-deoxy-L-rhamnonate aldolase RhmA